VKMFDANKTRMIGLPYGKKSGRYVMPFSSDNGTSRTDRRTDGRTDGRMDRQTKLLSISRVSVLTRDKNRVLSYGSKKKAYDRRILSGGGELTSYHSVCEAWCHFVFFSLHYVNGINKVMMMMMMMMMMMKKTVCKR